MPRSLALRRGRCSIAGQTYLLTTITHHRLPIFTDLWCARLLIQQMRLCCQQGRAESLAWVVMPDHLHWLLTLHNESLPGLMASLKAQTTRNLHQSGLHTGPVWQRDFHDHALRQEEEHVAVARYVVANPLRAGLCHRLGEYPHWDAAWL